MFAELSHQEDKNMTRELNYGKSVRQCTSNASNNLLHFQMYWAAYSRRHVGSFVYNSAEDHTSTDFRNSFVLQALR